ncbi:MAG: hypothetical protein ABJG40_09865, partial [Polaribacter sp.]
MIDLNIYKKKSSIIIIHILLWIILFAISASQIYMRIGIIPYDFYFKFTLFFIAFYLNYHIFVPKLLLKKEFLYYTATVLIFSIIFIFIIQYVVPKPINFGPANRIPRNLPPDIKKDLFFFRSFPTLVSLLLFFTLSTSIKLGIEWYKTEKEKVVIEAQKVSSE